MRKLFSHFALLTRKERRGVVALSGILLLLVMCTSVYRHIESKGVSTELSVQQHDSLMQQIAFMEKVKQKTKKSQRNIQRKYPSEKINLVRTVKKSDSAHRVPALYLATSQRDTIKRIQKLPEGTRVELNKADTTVLKQIPGIGSVISRRIVSYREQLGGYSHIKQLEEIQINADILSLWFTVDTTLITPLHLNSASLNQLRRHPYLNFYQARVIIEHRRKHGKIKSMKELALYEEFTEEERRRLKPYISFD